MNCFEFFSSISGPLPELFLALHSSGVLTFSSGSSFRPYYFSSVSYSFLMLPSPGITTSITIAVFWSLSTTISRSLTNIFISIWIWKSHRILILLFSTTFHGISLLDLGGPAQQWWHGIKFWVTCLHSSTTNNYSWKPTLFSHIFWRLQRSRENGGGGVTFSFLFRSKCFGSIPSILCSHFIHV